MSKIKWALVLAKPGINLKPPPAFTTKEQRNIHYKRIKRTPPQEENQISNIKRWRLPPKKNEKKNNKAVNINMQF